MKVLAKKTYAPAWSALVDIFKENKYIFAAYSNNILLHKFFAFTFQGYFSFPFPFSFPTSHNLSPLFYKQGPPNRNRALSSSQGVTAAL